MSENEPTETVTTNEAAQLLGVHSDRVHAMRSDGRLTVVGKGRYGINLFSLAEVQELKARRAKGFRPIPRQSELPSADDLTCEGCLDLREQLVEERRLRSEETRLRLEAETRSRQWQTAMNAALGE